MDNFDLKKYLAESTISEAAGKVLIDKTETRYVIVGEDGTIPKYFEKNFYTSTKRAQDALDGMVKSHEEYVDREFASKGNPSPSDVERQAYYDKMQKLEVQEVELKMTVTIK